MILGSLERIRLLSGLITLEESAITLDSTSVIALAFEGQHFECPISKVCPKCPVSRLRKCEVSDFAWYLECPVAKCPIFEIS
eukprot:COSAG03_NODE_787_length_5862_cov_14.468680_1_plen_81_part_10